jgi:nitrate reductase gamma subunit
MSYLNQFVFGLYPYLCMAVFLVGSLVRFDRDQYTWKSDSSQLLRSGSMRWASNLFHVGILFLFMGHSIGLLTPHAVYEPFISAGAKQLLAVISGGVFGALCFVGLTMLIFRRLTDARIRATSRKSDVFVLLLLWVQLVLGLATLPLSAQHLDGSVMLALSEWVQRIATFRGGAAELIAEQSWVFKAHLFLGMTMFLVFPFTRLVHVWSGFASVLYVFRPYQVVRSRKLNLPEGHGTPQRG